MRTADPILTANRDRRARPAPAGRSSDVVPAVPLFFQAEDGIRDIGVTGVQTCALPISFQGFGETYVGVLAVTILIAATNAGVLGVSRLTYSMGVYRQLPDAMRRLHPKFRTPHVGILTFSAIACLTLLPGQASFLGSIYAFGAMLSFSMAHAALIRLRLKH